MIAMKGLQYKSILKRDEGNPLFAPEEFPFGAADQVFNPTQVRTPDGAAVLFTLSAGFAGDGAERRKLSGRQTRWNWGVLFHIPPAKQKKKSRLQGVCFADGKCFFIFCA